MCVREIVKLQTLQKVIIQNLVKSWKLCNQSNNLLEMEWNLPKVAQLLYNGATLSKSSLHFD